MSGGEAAVRGKHRHEAAGGGDVGALLELQEGEQAAGDAGIAERHAVGKAEGAHEEVVDRPGTEAADGKERALGAGCGGGAQRLEVEFSLGDEARGGDDVVGLLAGELEREQGGRVERGDGGGCGRGVETVGEFFAGELDQAALQEAGEGKVDLLADDGPEQAVLDGGRLGNAEFLAACDQAGEPKLAGEASEGGGVLFETQEAYDQGVGFDGGARVEGDADGGRGKLETQQGGAGR